MRPKPDQSCNTRTRLINYKGGQHETIQTILFQMRWRWTAIMYVYFDISFKGSDYIKMSLIGKNIENPIWWVSHPHPPKNPLHYLLAIHIPFMVNSKLYIYFPGFVGVGLIIRIKDNSVWLDLTNLLELRFAIVVILVMNIRIFEYSTPKLRILEYIRLPKLQYSYSNI